MKLIRNNRYLIISILVTIFLLPSISHAVVITAEVDATDLPRGLLKASTTYSVAQGQFDFYYPQWLEGVHGPTSPIQNLAEISVKTLDGEAVPWHRDPHNVFHFIAQVPKNAKRLVVDTTYICNQASATSLGVDSHGTSQIGVVCWNTCLLYPSGHDISDVDVDLTLKLPDQWKWASSLIAKEDIQANPVFERISYRELVDSPLICGEYYNKYDITPENGTPHYLHLISESKQAIHPEQETVDKFKTLVGEAMALYGTAHDYDYHFLLILSDNFPFLGLEHLRSSLNAVGERGLDFENLRVTGHLLAHEYGHRWCGKYHRPAGMVTPDHNTPKDTRLLWVYEGLDQCLGVVLTARSGLFKTAERTSFEGGLQDEWVGVGKTIVSLMQQKGRRSINLEDTASSSYLRRRWGKYWSRLNRAQDYYFEGALLWYEIDGILRDKSDGELCLDDFVRKFLGQYDSSKNRVGFTENDVIDLLNQVMPYDWKTLIEDRVRGLHDDLPLTVLDRLGYRIVYANKPTDYDKDPSLSSLGMKVSDNGTITGMIPGGAGDKAGLFEDAKIIGVDNRKFSLNRLKDAIADSVATREIELLLLAGDLFKTVVVEYNGGPKYIDLVRNDDKADYFKEIFASKTVNH